MMLPVHQAALTAEETGMALAIRLQPDFVMRLQLTGAVFLCSKFFLQMNAFSTARIAAIIAILIFHGLLLHRKRSVRSQSNFNGEIISKDCF